MGRWIDDTDRYICSDCGYTHSNPNLLPGKGTICPRCLTILDTHFLLKPDVTEMKKMKENVNHPSHYNFGKYEVIDVIDDWKLGFSLGNAVKYIARAGKKDPAKEVEDLKKAVFYINHEIERLTEVEG